MLRFVFVYGLPLILGFMLPSVGSAQTLEAVVPILGISTGPDHRGLVTYASVLVEKTERAQSFEVEFADQPGRFSEEAKSAVLTAVHRTAEQLGIALTRVRATFRAIDPNTIIYGHSLSAIMALTTIALVEGHVPTANCAVTGTIEPDGRLGGVGRVTEKIAAAAEAHYSRVLVPDHPATYETNWRTPFLMQVSPIRTIAEAYREFTRPLIGVLTTHATEGAVETETRFMSDTAVH